MKGGVVKVSIGLKFFVALLAILCVFFTFIGVYILDFSLLAIGILFATIILLLKLEMIK
jgi:hypothetical protein